MIAERQHKAHHDYDGNYRQDKDIDKPPSILVLYGC
jgi:hypothetical protein